MNRKYEITENLDRLDARIAEQEDARPVHMKGIDTAVFEVLGEVNDALYAMLDKLQAAGFDDSLDRQTQERYEMLVGLRENVRDMMGDYFMRYCYDHGWDPDHL